MEKQYICGGTKYTFRHKTISLPVSFEGLPPVLEIESCRLLLKSSFHISLVCIGKIIEKFDVSIPDFENLVIKDFCDFTQKYDISLARYNDDFRFVTQNERRSVVVMAEVSNLASFFGTLNQKYKLNTETPPTHITLYTLQSDKGIFITDSKDLNQLTKVIRNPIKNIRFGSN